MHHRLWGQLIEIISHEDLARFKVTQNTLLVIYQAATVGNQCMSLKGFWQNYKYANIQPDEQLLWKFTCSVTPNRQDVIFQNLGQGFLTNETSGAEFSEKIFT